MTENKRFIVDYGQYCDVVYDNHESKVICRCVESGDAEYVSEKLNNQYEENMQLESTNMEYEDALGRLEKESEQLKKHIQELQNHLKRLENQNIQNYTLIKKAYNNERTQIGKNVLKQLIEVIE